jgi:hypothetical protein
MSTKKTTRQHGTPGSRDTRIRAGRISADVYLNETTRGKMFSVDVYANYMDRDGQWQRTTSFKANDLPYLENAARRAFDYCELKRDRAGYEELPRVQERPTRKREPSKGRER